MAEPMAQAWRCDSSSYGKSMAMRWHSQTQTQTQTQTSVSHLCLLVKAAAEIASDFLAFGTRTPTIPVLTRPTQARRVTTDRAQIEVCRG